MSSTPSKIDFSDPKINNNCNRIETNSNGNMQGRAILLITSPDFQALNLSLPTLSNTINSNNNQNSLGNKLKNIQNLNLPLPNSSDASNNSINSINNKSKKRVFSQISNGDESTFKKLSKQS